MELVGELEVDQQRAEAYTAPGWRLIFTHEPGDEWCVYALKDSPELTEETD